MPEDNVPEELLIEREKLEIERERLRVDKIKAIWNSIGERFESDYFS